MSRILKIRKLKINNDGIYAFCIAAYFALAVCNSATSALFGDFSFWKMFIRLGTYAVIGILLLCMCVKKRNITIIALLEVVAAAFFVFSVLFGNMGDTDWISVYKLIATTYIPLAVAAYNIEERKKIMGSLYFVAILSVPLLGLTAILSYSQWTTSYDMSLGYLMVFSVLVLLAHFTIQAKIYDIILAVVLGAFILFVGSRGPFICIIVFIAIELSLSKQYSLKKKTVLILLIALLSYMIMRNMDQLLNFAYRISKDMEFESRSLRLLMQGEAITHDSGRNVLQEYYMRQINKAPFTGYGVMGNWFEDGLYPHNIILEFLLTFGYPVGILLLAIITVIMYKGIRCEDQYDAVLAILFVSYCTHLFVSGTYLKVWQFFVCLALCLPKHGGIRIRFRERGRLYE